MNADLKIQDLGDAFATIYMLLRPCPEIAI